MKHQKHSVQFWIVFFIGLLPFGVQAAGGELLPPQIAIQTASDQMKAKLRDQDFKQDFAKVNEYIEEVIYPHVDFNRISALVLGKHWRGASKKQRRAFKKEFQTLLVRTYARAFLAFKDWSIRFLPMKLAGDTKKTLVKTEVLQPGKTPIAINYRMIQVKGKWKVYDIIIEGVSLVTNYRTSFKNEVKREGSLDAVIAKMSERNVAALKENEEHS